MGDASPETAASQAVQSPAASQRRILLVSGALLLLLLAANGVRCVREGWYEPPLEEASQEAKRKRRHRGTDFTAFYSAGELARRGENPYDYSRSSTPFRPYLYPPLFAVFPMAPLSLLPHNLALAAFYLLNLGLLGAGLWLLKGLFWVPGRPVRSLWRLPEVGLLLAVLACGRFVDSNLTLGQANIVIFFLLALALVLLARNRGLWGGLVVALATVYKLTPGLFGLYFLWNRRYAAMAGGALGLALFLFLAPAVVLGFEGNLQAVRIFAASFKSKLLGRESADSQASADPTPGGEVEEDADAPATQNRVGWRQRKWQREGGERGVGISLSGTLSKLLAPTTSLDERGGESRRVNLADFTPAQARLIARVLGLLLLLLTVALTLRQTGPGDPLTTALDWGLVAQLMLLISPLTRKAHAVVLILPVAALLAMLQQDLLQGWPRRLALASLALLGGVGLLTSPDLIGEEASELAHAYGAFTWSMLFFFWVLAWIIWRRSRASRLAEPQVG